MNTLDRVKTAYRVVDDNAPALALGNDASSGYSIIAHAAINQLRLLSPERAKTFLDGWARTLEDTERHAVITHR